MRRWLCLFLLVCLPLQLSWAVAASYCQHEQGNGVQHYGHHEHRHHHAHQQVPGDDHAHGAHAAKGQADDAGHDAHAGKPPGAADGDCAACHLGALQPLPVALNAPLADHLHLLVARTAQGHASHIPEGLDRPDIALAA